MELLAQRCREQATQRRPPEYRFTHYMITAVVHTQADLFSQALLSGQKQQQQRLLTFGEPPRPRAMAHTSVDFPEPLGPTTMLSRGPNCALASLYTRKFLSLRLTMEPSLNSETSAESDPEPVSGALLLDALLLTLVVDMLSTLLDRVLLLLSRAENSVFQKIGLTSRLNHGESKSRTWHARKNQL